VNDATRLAWLLLLDWRIATCFTFSVDEVLYVELALNSH
jgi:hypothetical protein